ncbi:MAG TPA: pyrimidine dimer DNA glycosylase/endonuclease V [Anaerolineales bacterium]
MRIGSLHPKYLDRQGLLAVWSETWLAQKVLKGETKGYHRHPQLTRSAATRTLSARWKLPRYCRHGGGMPRLCVRSYQVRWWGTHPSQMASDPWAGPV